MGDVYIICKFELGMIEEEMCFFGLNCECGLYIDGDGI